MLLQLVSRPSPSGQEEAVAACLHEHMRAAGFRVRRDAVGNLIAQAGETKAGHSIVLLGHMDTVPGPIPVRQEGGRLYGRGAVDAKGALAALVVAAERVAPRLRNVRLSVVGAVEEEACSLGARYLVGSMGAPDLAIVGEPSSWEGITIGYKGVLTAHYRVERAACHSASGTPTPTEEAVGSWNALSSFAASYNRDKSRRFDTLDPTLQSIRTFGDGLREGANMTVSVRIPPGLPVEKLKQAMRSRSHGSTLEFPYAQDPFAAGRDNTLVRAFLRAIRAAGGHPRFKLKTGTSDMNVIGPAWGCPVAAYGPGDSRLDHTPHEHIELAEFQRGVQVLTTVLDELIQRW